MEIRELAQGRYIHWGAYCSLYSGKTRSYLIKKGVEYVELNPSHPHFVEKVMPKLGYFCIPVLETPDGQIIQDSTDIIAYLEARHPAPAMLPEEKPLQAIAWLIHNYGTDGLFKPAMHYRWNYKETNYDFVIDEFTRGLVAPVQRETPEAKAQAVEFGKGMDAYLKELGVSASTVSVVEQSTEKLFDLLDDHFRRYPYLLGGRPSIADCGMMAPLYAHLGRDPHPAQLMKVKAPALYRWTETMNRAGLIDPELWHIEPEFFKADQLPESLMAILSLLCADFGPELSATVDAYHRWLCENPDLPAGAFVGLNGGKSLRQSLGPIAHQQQGATITRTAWADPLLTHQRVIDNVVAMDKAERRTYEQILGRAGGDSIRSIRFDRALTRKDYAAVLR